MIALNISNCTALMNNYCFTNQLIIMSHLKEFINKDQENVWKQNP